MTKMIQRSSDSWKMKSYISKTFLNHTVFHRKKNTTLKHITYNVFLDQFLFLVSWNAIYV